jgi:sugar phosphate isomerase/epimerase
MRIAGGAAHLTYCTNIHPGETWDEVRGNVTNHVLAVKRSLCPDRPFGVGLRLSARAAAELAEPEPLAAFRELLRVHGLYVFTINGFPYGPFHGEPVKEMVYRPDWTEEERIVYSDQLADLLAHLLPGDGSVEGSVSTVPGCFRPRGADPAAAGAIASGLIWHAAKLWRLRQQGGPTIGLALEPEPECLLETVADGVAFLERYLFCRAGADAFAALTGASAGVAEESLRRHVGLCLDACHAAVEFEEPAAAVAAAHKAGVRILKLQVSAGLRVLAPDAAKLAALERFAEGVYLHQVVIRRGRSLTRVLDLPEALRRAADGDRGDEWRIHFHVPLFREALGPFQSTQPFLAELLALQAAAPFTQHLEVETYTWDVLPEEYRREPVTEAIARELRWTLARLGEAVAP